MSYLLIVVGQNHSPSPSSCQLPIASKTVVGIYIDILSTCLIVFSGLRFEAGPEQNDWKKQEDLNTGAGIPSERAATAFLVLTVDVVTRVLEFINFQNNI